MPPRKTKRAATAAQLSDVDNNGVELWVKKTVSVLRESCQQRGLDTKGTKDVLVKRLIDYENGAGDSDLAPIAAKLKREDSDNTKIKQAFSQSLKKESPKKRQLKPDLYCQISSSVKVFDDYDCMLNQTNINANNNKFYVIQLLKGTKTASFYVWTRWGRVGEVGQNSLSGPMKMSDDAIKEFEKKFKDKTKNAWSDRENFVAHSGKYTLLELDDDDDEEEEDDGKDSKTNKNVADVVDGKPCAPSTLNPQTMELIKLLFDEEMFKDSMIAMDLDVKKMPLGKLSKSQISKGFDALVAIEDAIKAKKSAKEVERLCSTFYTLIPHSFGRQRPPLLDSILLVQKKKDMLLVLSDIELTQSLQKDKKVVDDVGTLEPHPLDVKYKLLNCKLTLMKHSDPQFKVIDTYVEKTRSSLNWKNINIWKVDRDGEAEQFKKHSAVQNRKLLWHGTNVAVVAAILNSGLRIMPHSGGRVGRGIYFASENGKSSGYVRCAGNGVGIMFLNEVALGKENNITKDNCSLVAAPKGFDSVVARGTQEPGLDTTILLDGKKVIVPQGFPVKTEYTDSYFLQSEYLVYQESQARIRYLLTFCNKK